MRDQRTKEYTIAQLTQMVDALIESIRQLELALERRDD